MLIGNRQHRGGLAGNMSNCRVWLLCHESYLSWVIFHLKSSMPYPASFLKKPKHFYCKEVQVCWNVSLPVMTLKTTYYFSTPVLKDQLFQHSLSLNPCHSQAFLLHVSEDLQFYPLGRRLWYPGSCHDGARLVKFNYSHYIHCVLSSYCYYYYYFWLHHGKWDLSSPVRIKLTPPALEEWSLNHQTIRDSLLLFWKKS